jgi:hypothetical protein
MVNDAGAFTRFCLIVLKIITRRNLLSVKCDSVFSNNFCFVTIDTESVYASVMFEMRAETRARLHVQCPLLTTDFDQNRNVSTDFTELPQCNIS